MKTLTMALLGKGGVGKTVLSALIGRAYSDRGSRVLFVDADPARGLTSALGAIPVKTIGEAREEIISKARSAGNEKDRNELSESIDYLLMESLYESPAFSLITMGSTSSLGCFCPVNSLLRETIRAMAGNYDVIVIDAEAGIEQVNRQVVETVDYPVIVTDNSMRGASTALLISDIIKRVPGMAPLETGVVFNRVESGAPGLVRVIEENGLAFYGTVGPDPEITAIDIKGGPLFSVSATAPSLSAVRGILSRIEKQA